MTADSQDLAEDQVITFRGFSISPVWILVAITLTALFLRFWELDSIPPGWRDDELINSLVISQKVIDGDVALYYPDASGHEALYHILSAGTLALFGPGAPGIRWLPALMGTLSVVLTFVLAKQMFGAKIAFVASLALALSFWSLMYSRIGIRHISLPVFMLVSFLCFWKAMGAVEGVNRRKGYSDRNPRIWFATAGLFLGISFYTYFASRGIPIILLLFGFYLLLFQRDILNRSWRGFLLMFLLALLLAVPLIITLTQQPETEARVEELAVPLVQAREGNFKPLGEHIARTLNMFHSDGDDEWLYNIPYRPVFGFVGALFFWSGVATALWFAAKPLYRMGYRYFRGEAMPAPLVPETYLEGVSAFVLIWWIVGISPGFVSVPPASLGHTIIAQSAVYILAALPILPICRFLNHRFPSRRQLTTIITATLAGIFLLSIAWRDLPDYFQKWPERGMTRFLYRADIKELADFLNQHEEIEHYGVTGLLAGPWDRLALEIGLEHPEESNARWYNSDRVVLTELSGEQAVVFSGYPSEPAYKGELYVPKPGENIGGFSMNRIAMPAEPDSEPICFTNGLCSQSAEYDPNSGILELSWLVKQALDLPSIPLVSNPPPPGVYAGPRLLVFAQLVDSKNTFLTGDDGLWVDPEGLLVGDQFIQMHQLSVPTGANPAATLFGLYDPKSGTRIQTLQGQDHIRLEIPE
ncbi:MAG: ArnT family glycosyltransferase [Candidatus Promineifilaceae bacterium]